MKHFIILIIFITTVKAVSAQSRPADTLMSIPGFYGGGGYSLAGGDLAKRFGNNFEVGGGFLFKTKKNWLFAVDLNYFFSNKLNENPLENLLTEEGYIIGNDGLYADVRASERGIKLPVIKAGKLFSFPIGSQASVNSGFFLMAGAGFIQHKINYEDVSRTVPQLSGDYVKGYDRLTNGIAVTQNAGYMYFDKRRRINLFVNLEFTQGFTKSRRSFDFLNQARDTRNRLDLMHGIKVGWIFPVYKKVPQEFYYH